MKEHILSALREQFDRWETLLVSLSDDQLTTPYLDDQWSIKDVMAHLWAWQQVSLARMEGGVRGREPDYPYWILSVGENWEEDADGVNALTFARTREKSWSEVYEHWRNGFLRLLETGEGISEQDLLDGNRYPWLKGYNLAYVLIASYDHHQEHLEDLLAWLKGGKKQ